MIKDRMPDAKPEPVDQDDPNAAMEACAQDLIDAVHSKDVQKLAQVLKDAYELCEQPEEDIQPEPSEQP